MAARTLATNGMNSRSSSGAAMIIQTVNHLTSPTSLGSLPLPERAQLVPSLEACVYAYSRLGAESSPGRTQHRLAEHSEIAFRFQSDYSSQKNEAHHKYLRPGYHAAGRNLSSDISVVAGNEIAGGIKHVDCPSETSTKVTTGLPPQTPI